MLKLPKDVLVSSVIQIQTHSNGRVTLPGLGAWGLGAAVPGTTSVLFSVPEVSRRTVKIPCSRLVKNLNGHSI